MSSNFISIIYFSFQLNISRVEPRSLIKKVFEPTREREYGVKDGRYSNSNDNIVTSRRQHNFS
jgi:hypothetical protein